MNTRLLAVIAATSVIAASADEFEVSAWRGETLAVQVPDYTELGEAPAGLVVRRGVLRPVKYRPDEKRLTLAECYDLVEWGAVGAPCVAEISVPRTAKPGLYKWGLMDIRVIDRELPPAREWKYYLDLWQHPWAVARVSRTRPFSREHYEAMRPIWELLATAGQKTLTVTLLDKPWNHQCRDAYGSMIGRVKGDDGRWSFDYSLFDEYVAFGRSCGLGPHIACYTMCPWGNRVTWQDARGGTHVVAAPPGSPEFADFWGDFLVDFAAHLKAKGWFADTYIAMDERDPKDVKTIADFVRSRAPGMKIAMAGNRKPSDFAGIAIDNYSQYLKFISGDFLAEVPARRAAGYITTHYVCCGPSRPNNVLNSETAENFWIGVYPAMAGLDGFLRWAWNSWPEDPLRDASFRRWFAGDTFLVYPGGAPSYRFLELRNGIVAAEKLRILREKGLFQDEFAALAARFDHEEAMNGSADFSNLKNAVLKFVNR